MEKVQFFQSQKIDLIITPHMKRNLDFWTFALCVQFFQH